VCSAESAANGQNAGFEKLPFDTRAGFVVLEVLSAEHPSAVQSTLILGCWIMFRSITTFSGEIDEVYDELKHVPKLRIFSPNQNGRSTTAPIPYPISRLAILKSARILRKYMKIAINPLFAYSYTENRHKSHLNAFPGRDPSNPHPPPKPPS
jgi:hypothetical protein